MKRRKEVILDFTSLLDIVLIILFFFILFSYMETGKVREEAEAAVSKADEISASADRREAEADYKIKEAESAIQQAKDELAAVRDINRSAGANLDALQQFGKNQSIIIKMDVSLDGNEASLSVFRNNELINTISSEKNISDNIKDTIVSCGYSTDDTLLISFFYDPSERGSYSAYTNIQKSFKELKKDFRNIYISETDESIFKEDQ